THDGRAMLVHRDLGVSADALVVSGRAAQVEPGPSVGADVEPCAYLALGVMQLEIRRAALVERELGARPTAGVDQLHADAAVAPRTERRAHGALLVDQREAKGAHVVVRRP